MSEDAAAPARPPSARGSRIHWGGRGSAMLGALLLVALGFALVAQLRQNNAQGLSALRQSDLVRILDDVGDRRDRLAAEASDLQSQQRALAGGATGSQAAIDAARARLDALGVLAGTVAATGPGIEVFVTDPQSTVKSSQVLDLVQELRDAGAEAIQIGSVRVVASTWFADAAGAVSVDGTVLRPPYTVLAIGDSQTMATALEIPGGVVASLPDRAAATVAAREQVEVTALHAVQAPRYARPATTARPSPS